MITLNLTESYKSLSPFSVMGLPNLTVLTGVNGSGKTHLLRAIEERVIKGTLNGKELTSSVYFHGRAGTHAQLSSSYLELETRVSTLIQYLRESLSSNTKRTAQDSKQQTLARIAELAACEINMLTRDEIFEHLPAVMIEETKKPKGAGDSQRKFHSYPALQCRSYIHQKWMNKWRAFRASLGEPVSFLSEDEFVDRHGRPPWEAFEAAFTVGNLHLDIDERSFDSPYHDIDLQIIHTGGKKLRANDLSSGESLLFFLASASYAQRETGQFPEILLLDEVDAALHPSWMKQFLVGLQRIFVEGSGTGVILATHSPSLVALAPQGSVYQMDSYPRSVSPDFAIGTLTEGVPSLRIESEHRRQVFVEASFDEDILGRVYEHLRPSLHPEISLSFVATGDARGGGCGEVRKFVRELRKRGNRTIFGIIDRDIDSHEADGLLLLGEGERYSIENFICDPLLIGASLMLRDAKRWGQTFGTERYTDFLRIDERTAQRIVDAVTGRVGERFIDNRISGALKAVPVTPSDGSGKTVQHSSSPDTATRLRLAEDANTSEDTSHSESKPEQQKGVSVSYCGGLSLMIPRWYLETQGHLLTKTIISAFDALKRSISGATGKDIEDRLCKDICITVMRDLPLLIPQGLLTTMQKLTDQ